MNLEEFLLLEKRIAQISANIDVTFSFDVIKTNHAEQRQDFDRRGLNVSSKGYISNREMSEFINLFREDIAEAIALGNIKDESNFIIRSRPLQLSMVIVAEQADNNYWKLVIKTVFRETDVQLKTKDDQFVLEK